jgi:hypothetical protein
MLLLHHSALNFYRDADLTLLVYFIAQVSVVNLKQETDVKVQSATVGRLDLSFKL